jgi:hypothetical protein
MVVCFAAFTASDRRRQYLFLIESLSAVKSLKNFGASLYRFPTSVLHFKCDAKPFFICLLRYCEVVRLLGFCQELERRKFSKFLTAHPLFFAIPRVARRPLEALFLSAPARKKTLPLAIYKKVADKFKKEFPCMA